MLLTASRDSERTGLGLWLGFGKITKAIWPKYKVNYKESPYVFHRTMCTRIMTSFRHLECRITDTAKGPLPLASTATYHPLDADLFVPYHRNELQTRLLALNTQPLEAARLVSCMQP